ncbi:MAG: helix-turn-helix domain-containing protein [Oscillospiraceae bacterium]|jgi:transcriptional regulator with XRE-family HTH domain|nr:helix-turn-helix domain-containing protein [Oscillospiraceae bacterium]
MLFAERVRNLRYEKKLKQEDIVIVLGVTKTWLSDIERGRRTTTLEKAVELADYFGVSLDYLVGRTDNPEINN